MKTIITLFTALFISITIHSQVYVSPTASGNNDGTTWMDAYTNLQDAFDNASTGSQIWIAAGTYFPTNNILPDSNWYEVNKPLEIYGGFAGTETVLSERDWMTNITTINGDLVGDDIANDFTTNRTDNARHLLVISPTAAGISIDGIVFSSGHANLDNPPMFPDDNSAWVGGGIAVYAKSTIRNCTFRQCNGAFGAGIWINAAIQGTDEFLIENSNIENNNSTQGALIIVGLNNPIVRGCTFQNNIATSFGGGMTVGNTNALIEDCVFQGNEVPTSSGGGLFAFQNNSTIIPNQKIEIHGCDFIDNVGFAGGGFCFNNFAANSQLVMDSCYFFRNTTGADGVGGGMILRNIENTYTGEMVSLSVDVTNCEFEKNSAQFGGGAYLFSDYIFTGVNFSNTIFTDNTAFGFGGGLVYGNASGKVEDCTFKDNEVQGSIGGGLFIFQNSLNQYPTPNIELKKTNFENNISPFGAGLTFNNFYPNSQIIIDSCVFFQNQATAGNASGGGALIQNILDTYGGGLSTLTPVILNSTFEDNSATIGGGVFLSSDFGTMNTTIFKNEFLDNAAVTGGGLYLSTSSAGLMNSSIFENEFLDNTASTESAGMHLSGEGDNMLVKNIFSKNQSVGQGAAMTIEDGANVIMENTLMSENTGVTTITNNDSLWMTNVTIAGNQQGLFQFDGAYTKIQNTILANTEENYLGIGGAVVISNGGNLSDDNTLDSVLVGFNGYPDFNSVNPELNMDFGLEQNSVCIDNGNPDGVTALTDLAGMPRVQGNEIDMGALESSFTISIDDLDLEKVKVFPNPFIDQITISDVEDMTGIRLLDMLGREVQRFAVQKELQIKANLPTGIYFLEFDFGGEKYLKKVEKIQ